MISQVISAPVLTKLLTVLPCPRISSNFRVKLPSKSITATDNEMNGNNKLPNKASGLIKLRTGPTIIPTVKRKSIDGILTHQANH